jgi:pyruvate dehydrogenase E1 component alpha subunit
MRNGEGPAFIECQTYRWREHVGPNEDFDQGYRAREDLHTWMKEDQVDRLGKMLVDDRRAAIDSDIELEISDAVAFAEQSPFPTIEKLYTNVFAGN